MENEMTLNFECSCNGTDVPTTRGTQMINYYFGQKLNMVTIGSTHTDG